MAIYLPYLGIGISLAGIAYLVARALPRIKGLPLETVPPQVGMQALWLTLKDYWRKVQPALMAFVARLLHRSRIIALKTDNRLSRWLESVKNRSRLVSSRPRTWFLQRQVARKRKPEISFAVLTEEKWKAKEEELLVRIKENPRDAALYAELADLYEKMGNLEDAGEARLTAEKLSKKK